VCVVRNRLIEQPEDVNEGGLAPSDDRPVAEQLLQQRKETLRAETERGEHGECHANATWSAAQYDGKSGDHHHAQRFHGIARRLCDVGVASRRPLQTAHSLSVNVAIDLLRAVQQYVADRPKPFL
jgi:hypothetical protein